MSIVRWDPFRELEDISSRLNRLFGQPAGHRAAEDEGFLRPDWAPAVDVQETDSEYLIKADLPEVDQNDVKVEVHDGMLSLGGERKQEREEKGKRFHRIERAYGRFERRLVLPPNVDPQKVAAFHRGEHRVLQHPGPHRPEQAPGGCRRHGPRAGAGCRRAGHPAACD